jgi:crotonobetainyl-CoA:carnitine CoA-transferase CaiB-like acyl-CoA transferase
MWWAPVQAIDEAVADPQVAAAGGLVEVPDGASTTTLPATPVDFSDTAWSPTAMAPEHGQHTDEVLRELGRDDAQIEALRGKGVVV